MFMCTATGIPAPTLSWSRGGSLLNTAHDSRITVGDHSDPSTVEIDGEILYEVTRNLTLDNTMEGDSGTYTCLAENGNAVMPSVAQDFELVVQSKCINIQCYSHAYTYNNYIVAPM